MAKRKNRRKKTKEAKLEHELPGGFWRQVVAVIMLAVAVILIMTWFGGGGTVLNEMHRFSIFSIGLATYAVPLLLVYLAVRIFRSDANILPTVMWLAAFLMIIWLAGAFGIPAIGKPHPTGGIVGEWLNSLVIQILEPGVAMFIYIVLIFITVIFILQISPKTVFKAIFSLFSSTKKSEDMENAKIARKAEGGKLEDIDIKVSSGVATMGTAKAAAAKASPAAAPLPAPEEKALVVVSDPDWKMPSIELLEKKQSPADAGNIQQNALVIRSTLAEFGIDVEMEGANIGPRVTQYTMRPASGVGLSKITMRDKELALNLAVDKIRIEAPIPGTRLVGVEIPNVRSADVRLRGIIESSEWKNATAPLTFAVGQDISGKAVVEDLADMPHLLIGGTTGSGKSVMTNALITSLLYRNSPSDLKLIIIDPKQVEMAQYDGIPHLLAPVITTVEKSLSALSWAVNEMERRYTLMAEEKVKTIAQYNTKMAKKSGKVSDGDKEGEDEVNEKMPYIVIVIDEMADLMMMAGKELEARIVRVAQKGRAAGMHLVLATQRPEARVITGLIKMNVQGRIAFAVSSNLDSRIMLDTGGAEKLLGKGDMLMLTTKMRNPRRIQGVLASDEDVSKLTNFLREQRAPEYNDDVISQPVQIKGLGPAMGGSIGDLGRTYDPNDPLVRKAVEISIAKGKFSTAMLQTYLGKGHGFVSGLAIWLEELGVIGPSNGNKPRDILIASLEEFDELVNL